MESRSSIQAPEEPSVVKLEHPDDYMDKILYTMANPVAAALVPKSSEYPGVLTKPSHYLDGLIEVARSRTSPRIRGAYKEGFRQDARR